MNTESMKQILSAPVNLLRPANEEERRLFHNKKGWFYTFVLESGPRFVTHIDKGKDIYTFRSLNNSADPLDQFTWYRTGTRLPGILPVFDVDCETKPGATDRDRLELNRILGPKGTGYTKKIGAFGFMKVKLVHYDYPEIFQKAYMVRERLVKNQKKIQELSEVRREFREGQRALQGLMIPNNNSTNQMIQHKLNERRQNG